MTTERRQILLSTEAQLTDRLAALRERYDRDNDGGDYPFAQLRELHLIERELFERRGGSPQSDDWVADNHTALWNATNIEPSLKYRGRY